MKSVDCCPLSVDLKSYDKKHRFRFRRRTRGLESALSFRFVF